VRGTRPTRKLQHLGPGPALEAHYDRVAHLCGREVYLRKDLTRDVPEAGEQCWAPLVAWNGSRAHHHWLVTEGDLTWHHHPHAL
jgi:hypothetical protein